LHQFSKINSNVFLTTDTETNAVGGNIPKTPVICAVCSIALNAPVTANAKVPIFESAEVTNAAEFRTMGSAYLSSIKVQFAFAVYFLHFRDDAGRGRKILALI